jgi:hypothetical protein
MKFKEYIKFKNYIILLSIAIVILAHLGTIRGRSGVDFEVRGAKSAILPQRDVEILKVQCWPCFRVSGGRRFR